MVNRSFLLFIEVEQVWIDNAIDPFVKLFVLVVSFFQFLGPNGGVVLSQLGKQIIKDKLSQFFHNEDDQSIRNILHMMIDSSCSAELDQFWAQYLHFDCAMLQIQQFSAFHILQFTDLHSLQVLFLAVDAFSKHIDEIWRMRQAISYPSHQHSRIFDKRNRNTESQEANLFYSARLEYIFSLLTKWDALAIILYQICRVADVLDVEIDCPSCLDLQKRLLGSDSDCAFIVDVDYLPSFIWSFGQIDILHAQGIYFFHGFILYGKIIWVLIQFTQCTQIISFFHEYFAIPNKDIQKFFSEDMPQPGSFTFIIKLQYIVIYELKSMSGMAFH